LEVVDMVPSISKVDMNYIQQAIYFGAFGAFGALTVLKSRSFFISQVQGEKPKGL
jgi:hypothetical protein